MRIALTISALCIAFSAHAQWINVYYRWENYVPFWIQGQGQSVVPGQTVRFVGSITVVRKVTGDAITSPPWTKPFGTLIPGPTFDVPYDITITIPAGHYWAVPTLQASGNEGEEWWWAPTDGLWGRNRVWQAGSVVFIQTMP